MSGIEISAVVSEMHAEYHVCGSHQLALTLTMDAKEAATLRDALIEAIGTGEPPIDDYIEQRNIAPATQAAIDIAEIRRLADEVGTATVKVQKLPRNGTLYVEPYVTVEWEELDWHIGASSSICIEQVRRIHADIADAHSIGNEEATDDD